MAGGIGSIIAYLGPNSRSIGTIVPDVVIEEAHRDALVITQHPVEKGAAITDHAFATPCSVVIRAGFSNSSAGYEGYAQEVYQEFLAWKKARDPRDVSTGKRLYQNMLPADISVITDGHSENILMITVMCQEVIITSTQTTGTGTDTTKAGANQADPATTGATTNAGPQQGTSVSDTAFAGAVNPGFNPSAGVGSGSIGDTGFGDVGSTLGGFNASAEINTGVTGDGGGIAPSSPTGDIGPIGNQGGTAPAVSYGGSSNPIFGPDAIGGP